MALNEMVKVLEDDQIRELIEAREKARNDEANRLYHAVKEAREKVIIEGINTILKSKVIKLLFKKFPETP